MGPDWTDLPEYAVNIISEKACNTNLQYLNLRMVCKDWLRALAPYPRHLRRGLWLLLPRLPKDVCRRTSISDSELSFYDVLKSQTYRFQLPYIRGKNICGSSHGWLVLEYDNKLSLFDPIAGSSMDLPSLYPTILNNARSDCSNQNQQYTQCVYKVTLSGDPSKSGCIVVAHFLSQSSDWELGFCKIGDTRWTGLKRWDSGVHVSKFTCHNNKVYTINKRNDVSVCDLQGQSVRNFSSRIINSVFTHEKLNLVEGSAVSAGEPLIVRFRNRLKGITPRVFVYKWYDDTQEWRQVHDIGKRVISLNSWHCVSLNTVNLLSGKELKRGQQENDEERLGSEVYYAYRNYVTNGDFDFRIGIDRVNLKRGTAVPCNHSPMELFSSISGSGAWFTPSLI